MLPKNYKKPSSYKTTTRKKPVYKSKKLAAGGPGDPPKDGVPATPVDNTSANQIPFLLDYAAIYPEGISAGRLNESSKQLKNYFLDSKGEEIKEGDRVDFIQNTMGPYSNGSWLDPVELPWSAVTTSYLMGEYLDARTPEEMKAKGFRPDVAHATYIADAFETARNPNHIYNRYIAKELPNTLDEIQVGDLFFRGRGDTPNTFKGVKKASKKLAKKNFDRTIAGYKSHTDIVVEKGIDPKGAYVVLAGGNVGDTILRQKVYLDDIKSDYAGVMVQNPNMELPSPSVPRIEAASAQDYNPMILPTFGMAAGGNLMTDGYMNVLAAGGEMTEGDPTSPSTSTNSLTEQEKNLILDSIKKAAPGIGEYQMEQIYDNFFADEDSIPYTRNMLLSDKLDETVQLVLGSRLASKALSGEKPGFRDIISTLSGAQGDIKTALINMGVPPEQAVEYLKEQARQAGADEENLGYIDRLGGKGLLNPFNFFDYELPADRFYVGPRHTYASFAAGGNMYANGGPQDMLTNIENGGTHEENPLGGVPMGPNASVEQGETIQRNTEPGTDFVFSDRLPEKGITKEMAAEYNLPKNMVGKTFANASKTIEKQNHRKHDLIDKNTKDVALARLRDAQEEYKDRAFREQLAEIEDKFGKSATEVQQPSPEEQAMMQQQMQGAAQPAQPSPEEMMAMQMGMGQEPPQGIPAPPAQMPGQPMGQPMAPQMASEGMDPNREAQIRAALQNAYGGPVQMAAGGPDYYPPILDPNGSVAKAKDILNSYNIYPERELMPPIEEMDKIPLKPITQEQYTPIEPIEEIPSLGLDNRIFADNELIKSSGAEFVPPTDTPLDFKIEDFKDFDPNEWLEGENENEYVDRYRQGIFADAYAKLFQSIKPIRERNAAAYFINAQYDPINYPIEAQRKALKDMSSSTRRLLANRMGSSPGTYMAMMGKINADEALQTADLFDKKYTAEAQDVQRIRELNNQNSEFNMRMKQLVEELNEKDLQGKEQLALEAANSFAETYQGLRKEDFMKFIAEEYKILYNLTEGGDFLEEEEDKDKDKEDKENKK